MMIQVQSDNLNALYMKSDNSVTIKKEVGETSSATSLPSVKPSSNNVTTHNSVDVNMNEQNLIANLQTELQQLPDIDMPHVTQIRQQIEAGEFEFNMGELANVLVNRFNG